MAVTARYTDQIVILTTPGRAEWIKAVAYEWGVSQAQVARDCIELGSELLVQKYEAGLGGLGVPSVKPVTRPRSARVSETGAAPVAQFRSAPMLESGV